MAKQGATASTSKGTKHNTRWTPSDLRVIIGAASTVNVAVKGMEASLRPREPVATGHGRSDVSTPRRALVFPARVPVCRRSLAPLAWPSAVFTDTRPDTTPNGEKGRNGQVVDPGTAANDLARDARLGCHKNGALMTASTSTESQREKEESRPEKRQRGRVL